MDLILQGFLEALRLLWTLDREVLAVVLLTLQVSGTATALSVLVGCTAGTALALSRFPGRTLVIASVNMGMGLPPVVVGLFVTIFIWRSGPLGFLGILYTPAAMVLAQTIIAVPIVTGISLAAIQQLPRELPQQILALGATRAQMVRTMVVEARLPLMAAVMAGFGGAVSEIGASIMVGGNIKGHTRVLTTATVMETGKGNFATAIALGLILLALGVRGAPGAAPRQPPGGAAG
jgi:tungstate transport system permease protein